MILVLLTAGGVFLAVIYNLFFKRNPTDDKKTILPLSEVPASESTPPPRHVPVAPELIAAAASEVSATPTPETKVNVETVAAPVAAAALEEPWVIEASELASQSQVKWTQPVAEEAVVAFANPDSILGCSKTLSQIDDTLKRLESRITTVVQENTLTADEENYLLQNTEDLLRGEKFAAVDAPVSAACDEKESALRSNEEAANILHKEKPSLPTAAAVEEKVEIVAAAIAETAAEKSVDFAELERNIIVEKDSKVESTVEAEIADAVETVFPAPIEEAVALETIIECAAPNVIVEVCKLPPRQVDVSSVEILSEPVILIESVSAEPESATAEIQSAPEVIEKDIVSTEIQSLPEVVPSEPVAEIAVLSSEPASVEIEITESKVVSSEIEPITAEIQSVPLVELVPSEPETAAEQFKSISELVEQVEVASAELIADILEASTESEPVVSVAIQSTSAEVQLSQPTATETTVNIDTKPFPVAEQIFAALDSSPAYSLEATHVGYLASATLEPISEIVAETETAAVEVSPAVEVAVEVKNEIVAEVKNEIEEEVKNETVKDVASAATEIKEAAVEVQPEETSHVPEIAIATIDAAVTEEIKSDDLLIISAAACINVPGTPDNSPEISVSVDTQKASVEIPDLDEAASSVVDSVINEAVDILEKRLTSDAFSQESSEIVSEAESPVAEAKPEVFEKAELVERIAAKEESSENIAAPALKDESEKSESIENIAGPATKEEPEKSTAESPATQSESSQVKSETLVELVIESPKTDEKPGSAPESTDKAEIQLETLAAAEPLILDKAPVQEEASKASEIDKLDALLVDLGVEPTPSTPTEASRSSAENDLLELESFVVVPKEKQVMATIDNVYTLIAECQSAGKEEESSSSSGAALPSVTPINSSAASISNLPPTNEPAAAKNANE